jgi:hypothetical protein
MREQEIKSAPAIATRPANRSLLAAAAIGGLLSVVLLEVTGYDRLLPMLAALLVAAGFSIATVAWISGAKRSQTEITSWDLAGVLVLLGFATTIIN